MSNQKLYAGIGSRETPPEILSLMQAIACYLSSNGWTLRSGGARGADSAFESGTRDKEIFKAEDATEEAIALAAQHHPRWDACPDYAKKLHGRNSMILLGSDLDAPVKFVCCWTPGGKVVGGTGQALRMSSAYGIEIRNLANLETRKKAELLIK